MDGSGIGPIAPAVKLIKNISKVLLDPSGKQVDKSSRNAPVEKSLQKSEGPAINIDKTPEKFPSIESLLPVKILANPLLMRSEWAWKRLLVTAMEARVGLLTEATETRAEVAESKPGAPVSATVDLPVKPGEVRDVQNLATPVKIASATAGISRYEAAVKILWSILVDVSGGKSRDSWRTEVTDIHSKGPVVQFSQLQHGDLQHLSPVAQQWVIEDRMTSSVQVDSYERAGQGLFIPPGHSGRLGQVGHRYYARKQTRITGRGKLVHRIQFDFRVNDQPVRCTITSAKPSLLVHFDTNSASLRVHLEIGREGISKVLINQGWQLEQWSVSPFGNEAEAKN
jgi:hypothetical protein